MRALFIILFATSSLLYGQTKTSSQNGLSFRASTGVGVFQDIQLPVSDQMNLRSDGTPVGPEHTDHIGIPLIAAIGSQHRFGDYDLKSQLTGIYLAAASGAPETAGASYSRFGLAIGGEKALLEQSQGSIVAGLGLDVRRSMYRNISHGHYLDSLGPKFSLGWHDARYWNWQASVRAGAINRFGYDGDVGDHTMTTAQVSSWQVGTMGSWALLETTWLDFGIESEIAQVVIEDVQAYQGFGLNVGPQSPRGRSYQMVTTLMTIGYRTLF